MKRKVEEKKKNDLSIKKKREDEKPKILTAEEREKRKTSLFRAPTSDELNELRENENLYKNNLFRMQIQYLLEEVCLEEKKINKINNILHTLNSHLAGLSPSDKQCDLSEVDLPADVVFPLSEVIPRSKLKGKFQFFPPKEVKVIGSYLLKTLTKPNGCIDVAVEIPKECFQGRDYLNYRYQFKRATYLSWLATSLKEWEHMESLMFVSHSNTYKPCLLIKLKGKIGNRFSIKVHLSIPEDVFKLNRFSPLKNNVRSNWYEDLEDETAEELEFPTPHYNSTVLSDMLFESHLHALYAAVKECPGMKDAICLFKVWLKQRSFKGDCSFSGFIGSMLMVYLLSNRKVSSHMSSYQIFRLVLNTLASSDWTKNGITMCTDEKCQAKLGDFHGTFEVVFVDQSGYLNLCADVNKITYGMIKHEAEMSLQMLDSSSGDGFDALFIKCQYFLQSVDQSFQLSNLDDFKLKFTHSESHRPNIMDNGGDWSLLVPKIVGDILQKGLDKRVHRLFIKPCERLEWNIDSVPPTFTDRRFQFGFHLNTEFSDNVLIMGPPADQPEDMIKAAFTLDRGGKPCSEISLQE